MAGEDLAGCCFFLSSFCLFLLCFQPTFIFSTLTNICFSVIPILPTLYSSVSLSNSEMESGMNTISFLNLFRCSNKEIWKCLSGWKISLVWKKLTVYSRLKWKVVHYSYKNLNHCRSYHPEVLCKKCVLRNSANTCV